MIRMFEQFQWWLEILLGYAQLTVHLRELAVAGLLVIEYRFAMHNLLLLVLIGGEMVLLEGDQSPV